MRELEIALKKSIYTESYYEFFKFAFDILHPAEMLSDNFHIQYLCDELQSEFERILRGEPKEKDLIINIPPRTSKSLITSVCYIAWVWIRKPELKFITISYDSALALLNSQLSKDLIKSEKFQELFGDCFSIRGDADSKEYFANNKGGYRISKTNGSNITGFSGAIIILDDPQSAKSATSEVERKATIDYWDQSLYNRLTPINLGLRILVQQRLHENDLSGYLLAKDNKRAEDRKMYKHICLPAEINEDEENNVCPPELAKKYTNGLLDPNRLDRKTLLSLIETLGTIGYTGQYKQKPSAEKGGIIDKKWFDIVDPYSLERDVVQSPINFFVDGAYTENTNNDPSVIMACFVKNNFLYVLDVEEVYLTFPEFINFLKKYVLKWKYSTYSIIYVEPKATGKSIVQQIRFETNLNIAEHDSPKDSKLTRVTSISPILESRRVKLIEGDYVESFLDQLSAFPFGSHDDKVDVLEMATSKFLVNNSLDFYFV